MGFLAVAADRSCAAGDVLARVSLHDTIRFPGQPPSRVLLIDGDILPTDVVEERYSAICDALIEAGFGVDDIAALWLMAERHATEQTMAHDEMPAPFRVWLRSVGGVSSVDKCKAAMAWPHAQRSLYLDGLGVDDECRHAFSSLDQHCASLFATLARTDGAISRSSWLTSTGARHCRVLLQIFIFFALFVGFAWAIEIIDSRGFRVNSGAPDETLCIAPFVALPAPAPDGVGCVERVVDLEEGLVARPRAPLALLNVIAVVC